MWSVLCRGTRHSKSLSLLFMEREPLKFVPVKFCPVTCPPTTASASCTGRCRAVRALRELSSKAQCPDSRAFHGVISKDLSICLVEMCIIQMKCRRCIPGKFFCFTELTQPFECQAWEIVSEGDFAKCTVIFSQGCYAECEAWGHRRCCNFQPKLLCCT